MELEGQTILGETYDRVGQITRHEKEVEQADKDSRRWDRIGCEE